MKFSEVRDVAYSNVQLFEGDDYSFTETYHEYTKLTRENSACIGRRVARLVSDPRLRRTVTRAWKTYRGQARIPLPTPTLGSMTLEEAFRRRFSVSAGSGVRFTGAPISLAQLSALLAFSYGVTHRRPIAGLDEEQLFRATCSAGGLYPLEVYPVVSRVEGLPEGLYHYRVVDHSLEVVRQGDCWNDFVKANTYAEATAPASVGFAVSAVFQRNLFKYQHRGYRFIMNDTGALLQSFYLAATALGLGSCAIGGFYDDELGRFLGINNVDEAPVICHVFGPVS